MTPYPKANWLETLRIYLGISALFHFAWEMLLLPFYTIWTTGTFRELAFAVLHCTIGNLMIASMSLLIALLAVGNSAWPSERFIAVTA